MNRKIKTLALFTALSFFAVSCQKETSFEQNAQLQQSESVRNVVYTIDGLSFHTVIRGEKDWSDFIDWLMSLATEGRKVTFRNGDVIAGQSVGKEVHTYTTTDKKKASAWCQEMSDAGYEVTMVYDAETGIYTCVAVR